MVWAIRDVLLDETWNSNELLNELADAMYVKFEKYWSKPSIVLLFSFQQISSPQVNLESHVQVL